MSSLRLQLQAPSLSMQGALWSRFHAPGSTQVNRNQPGIVWGDRERKSSEAPGQPMDGRRRKSYGTNSAIRRHSAGNGRTNPWEAAAK